MIRRVIEIDEEKCNGCGLCASACHEGALAMVDGKAKLVSDEYCDGFGDCLPACPQGAIAFVKREAAAYDEEAVRRAQAERADQNSSLGATLESSASAEMSGSAGESRLENWPVQIKLAPVRAPYFDGAHLLVAADCTAFAFASFHERFMHGCVTLVGCPKLDGVDYAEKLGAVVAANDIKRVAIARMTVPCCGGLEMAVARAVQASGKNIPCEVAVISTDGELVEVRAPK